MSQTILVGCELQVVEQPGADGELVRCLVATNPRSGDQWAVPMPGAIAIQIGRALAGQAIFAPPDKPIIRVDGRG